MKIIKPGNINLLRETKLFRCKKCGCVFEADKGEYEYLSSPQYNDVYYLYPCPTCGNTVYTHE